MNYKRGQKNKERIIEATNYNKDKINGNYKETASEGMGETFPKLDDNFCLGRI